MRCCMDVMPAGGADLWTPFITRGLDSAGFAGEEGFGRLRASDADFGRAALSAAAGFGGVESVEEKLELEAVDKSPGDFLLDVSGSF